MVSMSNNVSKSRQFCFKKRLFHSFSWIINGVIFSFFGVLPNIFSDMIEEGKLPLPPLFDGYQIKSLNTSLISEISHS